MMYGWNIRISRGRAGSRFAAATLEIRRNSRSSSRPRSTVPTPVPTPAPTPDSFLDAGFVPQRSLDDRTTKVARSEENLRGLAATKKPSDLIAIIGFRLPPLLLASTPLIRFHHPYLSRL